METIDRTAAIRHREYGASRKQVTSKALRHNTSVWVPWLAFEKRLAEAIGEQSLPGLRASADQGADGRSRREGGAGAVRTLADGRS